MSFGTGKSRIDANSFLDGIKPVGDIWRPSNWAISTQNWNISGFSTMPFVQQSWRWLEKRMLLCHHRVLSTHFSLQGISLIISSSITPGVSITKGYKTFKTFEDTHIFPIRWWRWLGGDFLHQAELLYVEVLKVTVRRILSFFFVVMTMTVHQSMGVPTGTGSMMPQSTSSSKLFLTASVR